MLERLTFRDELGVACYKWKLLNKTKIIANEAISRLAAYEGSGLSPEEVQELAKAKADGRLVEVVRCKDCDMGYVDKDMSSPDRGWWYGCKDHKNHFKRADGYCSMGVPREEAEKAMGGESIDKG